MTKYEECTVEELLISTRWTLHPPNQLPQCPIEIDELKAIELAVRAICGKSGRTITQPQALNRPIYKKRPSYVRQLNGKTGPDEWGWAFWFPFPLPENFEPKSFPVFVNDPSGVVEFGDAM